MMEWGKEGDEGTDWWICEMENLDAEISGIKLCGWDDEGLLWWIGAALGSHDLPGYHGRSSLLYDNK